MVANVATPENALIQRYIELYPEEAARQLDDASTKEAMALLAVQDGDRSAALLSRISPDLASECVAAMDDAVAKRVLPQVEITHLAALISRLAQADKDNTLAKISPDLAQELRELLAYPQGTAGHIMDPRVYTFRPDLTVQEVLDRLHTLRQQRIRDLLLVNDQGQLVGAVPLPDIVMADSNQRLQDFSKGSVPSVQALAPREDVVQALANSRLASLPVVDINGKLVGVIRHNTLAQAIAEEATVGMQTMVGVGKEERALSSPMMTVRKRLPWLNINLLTAFVAAAVVGLFENTIAQVTALAVLLPVVAGQSGNTGAQALAVTMRGLALREVRVRQWPKLVLKEATAGTINGIAIAIVTMIGVYIWSQSLPLCLVIGVAMVMSMAIAAVAGTLIPIVLTAMNQDPAASSSIVLTTITDVAGFFSFLGLATLFITQLL